LQLSQTVTGSSMWPQFLCMSWATRFEGANDAIPVKPIDVGNVLMLQCRFEDALASYERALSIRCASGHADCSLQHNNCGNALMYLHRFPLRGSSSRSSQAPNWWDSCF